jgi:thioredoxin 1
MAEVIVVNEGNFHEVVMESDVPVLADFWAPWCGYCQKLMPIVEELAGELAPKIKFVKINVDENRGLAQSQGVMSLPTLILFKNGEVTEKILGFKPKADIQAKLSPLIGQ